MRIDDAIIQGSNVNSASNTPSITSLISTVSGVAYSLLFTGVYYGLYVSNDATNNSGVIDIAAGAAADTVNAQVMILPTAFTKNIQSGWVAGTGNGGLESGVVQAVTWYYPWLIMNPTSTNVDVLISFSPTSPVMPTGYTWKRRIRGAFRTDSASKIIGFVQMPDYTVMWGNSTVSTNTNATFLDVNNLAVNTATVVVNLTVPPLSVRAKLNYFVVPGGSSVQPYFSSTSNVNEAPSTTVAPLLSANSTTGTNAGGTLEVYANISGQIRIRTNASSNIYVATLGWLEALS